MQPTLHIATSGDLPFLQELARYYVYDMSEFTACPIGPDGRYSFRDDSFWQSPRFRKHVIRVRGEPAGFAAVDHRWPESDVDADMADFFLLRKFRGQGVATRVAHDLFALTPGRWQIRVYPANAPAVAFWRKTVASFSACRCLIDRRHVPSDGAEMIVHRFDSPPLR